MLSRFVETVATVVKSCISIAKDVAEFAKCFPVVSSALKVVVTCASLAETGMEMTRAKVEWPRIYARMEALPGALEKSMILVVHPNGQVDVLLVNSVFKLQHELTYFSHCKQTTHVSYHK